MYVFSIIFDEMILIKCRMGDIIDASTIYKLFFLSIVVIQQKSK